MKVFSLLLSCFISISLLGACPSIKNGPWITVWVHGTKQFISALVARDFFYNRIGMHSAADFDEKYHVRFIADQLGKTSPDLFPFEHFYFFGWDGRLSFESRFKAGKDLYKALKKLKKEFYAQYHCEPKIRLITHSHGGNVALNASLFYKAEDNLYIDELILLACPVQEKTKHNIKHPFFERCYSVFCPQDTIQMLDPQKLHYLYLKDDHVNKYTPFFSEQIFDAHQKLRQVKITFSKKNLNIVRYLGLAHLEFLLQPFIDALPELIHTLNAKKSEQPNSSIIKYAV